MPKARSKRRLPVTSQQLPTKNNPSGARTVIPPIHVAAHEKIIIDTGAVSNVPREKLGKSSTETRRRINRFHILIKEQAKLMARRAKESSTESQTEIQEAINSVLQEMARMGGLDWYQKASLLGQCKQRGGDTSRWLVPKLNELGFGKSNMKEPLKLLDVGALSCLNYAKERSWIDVVPIDLNSQEPGIYQQDFLDIDLDHVLDVASNGDKLTIAAGDEDVGNDADISHLFTKPFDVVSLSLVVNFIGDPIKRGDMLKQARRLLAPNGLLFLVLPLSCTANSRYFDDERLLSITQHLGFTQLYVHHTAKLAYHLYRLTSASIPIKPQETLRFKKQLLHSAPGRNNFSIAI
ncbi:25S rRNA (adenine2142-N1)-methyltransferase [Coemansia sp. RSA 1843]|nr:25S rRNA (adenine2142-N1)-methyltransferase [Coemansia sp. RSA 1843]